MSLRRLGFLFQIHADAEAPHLCVIILVKDVVAATKFLSKLSSLALQVAVTQQPLLSLPAHKVRAPYLSRRPCQRSLDEHSVDAIAMAALVRPFPLSPLRQRPYGSEHFSRLHAREVFGLAAVLHGLGAVAAVLRDIA